MSNILQKLKGGDLRSIGRSEEVVQDIFENPDLFSEVFEGMLNDDPIVKMRSADAVEKVSLKHPEYLHPYKRVLIEEIAKIEQQEVKWHVAQMLPRLNLDSKERSVAVNILLKYLDDNSRIVKTFSMQALADFAEEDITLRPKVIQILEDLIRTGSPAMKSRGNKILAKMINNKMKA